MLIRELAQRTGISPKTIRYYESVGLLPRPQRADNHYRLYTEADVELLRFIVGTRSLGYSLAEIARFLAVGQIGSLPCQEVLTSLDARLSAIERRIADLEAVRDTLERIRSTATSRPQPQECDEQCVCHLLMTSGDGAQLAVSDRRNAMDEYCPSESYRASADTATASEHGSNYTPDEHVSMPQRLETAQNTTHEQVKIPWRKAIGSGFLFLVACIASPCCAPLIVQGGFALLAGTPVAIWMAQDIGWIYAGLTLLSLLSFVGSLYWMRQKSGFAFLRASRRRNYSRRNFTGIKAQPIIRD